MDYTLLLNPILVSVIILCTLCLCKVNVILSIILSTIVAGMLSHFTFTKTMNLFISGMGANSETALSYILLGTFAAAITTTGLATILSRFLEKIINGKKRYLVLVIILMAVASQNLIPIHIAFIPILIPPLLSLMNKLKIDRRMIASALAFGLKMPYIVIPAGFGLIFQGLIADYMTKSGMNVTMKDVWHVNWFLGLAMLLGLLIAIFVSYRKPREYKDLAILETSNEFENITFNRKHLMVIIAAIATLLIQLVTGSLPLGAVIGLTIIFATGVVDHKKSDDLFNQGILLMGNIAFVMLIAAGFALVLQQGGGIETLLNTVSPHLEGNKFISAFTMLLIGLFISMGIGTSFGTIPILTVLFVPICAKLGLSVPASIILMSATAALGDAGSPVSDTTLGPTSGLNADGQHDHIKDTCVPTFLHFNIPLIIFALIAIYIF